MTLPAQAFDPNSDGSRSLWRCRIWIWHTTCWRFHVEKLIQLLLKHPEAFERSEVPCCLWGLIEADESLGQFQSQSSGAQAPTQLQSIATKPQTVKLRSVR